MTVQFASWGPRERVAAMLEAPSRVVIKVVAGAEHAEAWADIHSIIAELDRIDRVNAAKRDLRIAFSNWQAATIEKYAKVTDAPAGSTCSGRSAYGYRRAEQADHKAKFQIGGRAYCGTHLRRAQRSEELVAIRVHRDEYHDDPALEAIVDADRELIEQRRRAGL